MEILNNMYSNNSFKEKYDTHYVNKKPNTKR